VVDLIDDHDIDQTLADINQQAFECGPFHGTTRYSAVVVGGLDELPSFRGLALDKRLVRLPLIVQGVEVLLQALF
jgi:hypothetical protein